MPEPLGTVGRYDLLRLLGTGGMGEVYLARDAMLDRPVAIKVLRDVAAGAPEARRALQREARAAAALDHPNICAVYEVGTDTHGRDFIAMQYVEGDTLADRLRAGGFDVKAALDLVAGIAEALDAAHRRGVVHRDLKPQNVIITPSGQPKLLDFGIASLRKIAPGQSLETTGTHVEPVGLTGTPAYMAPEILQGREADARSDLFSLGVVLYECLTGVQPFLGRTAQETWGRILHVEPRPPSELRRGIDPALDTVCRRLLAKDPASRFQSAAEVRGALEVVRERPEPARRANRWRWRAAGSAALASVGAAAVWWSVATGTALPAAPPDAAAWYARGSDAVRQGAYGTGRKALEEAIRLFPDYALAHARLAEALSELDDERAAQTALIRVSALTPNQWLLGEEDRLRLAATRASVLRDHDEAIQAYAKLAALRPSDAGALVDLGRAQEAAGRLADARTSYEQATRLDQQFAAGFLRLGVIVGAAGAVEPALASLAEAERLYTLASNVEGQVETLLRRAAILDQAGRFGEALRAAEQAERLASQAGLLAQGIRAGLRRGSALVGTGAFDEAQATIAKSVDQAVGAGLEGIAADGLIDLAGTLLVAGRLEETEAALVRASALAGQRSLTRIVMRATSQRASLKLEEDQPREALALLQAPLEYFAQSRLALPEAFALNIASRAHLALGETDQARGLAERVRTFAAANGNDDLRAHAATTLARLALMEGQLPVALDRYAETAQLRRELGDTELLPYTLANQAEVLILLGRGAEADGVLQSLEAGIATGLGAFPTRKRRVAVLRALRAVIEGRHVEGRQLARQAERLAPGRDDETGRLARMLAAVAAAHAGARAEVPAIEPEAGGPSLGGQALALWRATALLAQRQARACADEASQVAAANGPGGAEVEWRAAALVALASQRLGEDARAADAAARASSALDRLKGDWGAERMRAYETRRDVAALLAGLRTIGPPAGT